jgi:hypothetical protein
VSKLAKEADSKSAARKRLWVRVPPAAFVRPAREVRHVRSLKAQGLSNCEIARRTGIPRATVRDWVRGTTRAKNPDGALGTCPRCGGVSHRQRRPPAEAYAYLLGLYLGDGHISRGPRNVFRLRITLDVRYGDIIRECAAALSEVLPENRILVRPRPDSGCVDVGVYSKQLPCLFPQHGSGPKHKRRIALERWQQGIVEDQPGRFLRGLIHSDGCRSRNRVTVRGRSYSYPRYTFSNTSADIRRLFCVTCEQLGIKWRRMNARNISVARRLSVARLDEFVGPKR